MYSVFIGECLYYKTVSHSLEVDLHPTFLGRFKKMGEVDSPVFCIFVYFPDFVFEWPVTLGSLKLGVDGNLGLSKA